MSNGIPSGSVGIFVIVFLYSVICLAISLFLVYLVWRGSGRYSYVAFLSLSVTLCTLTSIVEQLHLAFDFVSITNDLNAVRAELNTKPIAAFSGSPLGLDLWLFWIQFYCWNLDSLLVFFWAIQLLHGMSDNAVRSRLRWEISDRLETASKVFAIFFPAILFVIAQIRAIQNSMVGFFILCDVTLASCLIGGSVLLTITLSKFVKARGLMTLNRHPTTLPTSEASGSPKVDRSSRITRIRQSDDRWAMTRLIMAIILLGAFEMCVILFQGFRLKRNQTAIYDNAYYFTVTEVNSKLLQDISGVSASLAAYLVWGTTREHWKEMKRIFCCGRLKRGVQAETVNEKLSSSSEQLSSRGTNDIKIATESSVVGASLEDEDSHYNVEISSIKDRDRKVDD